jgi:purine-binding chemotaxis protein CheW
MRSRERDKDPKSEAQHAAPDNLARLFELEGELRALRRAMLPTGDETRALLQGDLPLLRCRVGDDEYGVPIESVVEILRYVQVTRVADVPSAVAGAINVRGRIVAVIDARRRFAHAARAPRLGTAIVLTRTHGRTAGLVVDHVLDVVTAPSGSLCAPEGPLARAQGIMAIATLDRTVIQIIDLDQVLSGVQWDDVARALESNPPPAATTTQEVADE